MKQLHLDLVALGFDGSYDRVAAFANQVISLRVYADCLVMTAHGEVIAEHVRLFSRDHSSPGKTSYDWRHYLAVVQRKPGALRNGAPFQTLPRSFQRLQRVLLKQSGGDRQMADILSLVLHHDEQMVEQAVREALHSGVPTKTHILNRLGRLLDAPRPAPLQTPPALFINDEPIANTERYDYLREAHHYHILETGNDSYRYKNSNLNKRQEKKTGKTIQN